MLVICVVCAVLPVTNNSRSSVRNLAAYSLVEVLVASAIVGIIFVSVYAGISSSFRITLASREQQRAMQILNEKLELIRLYTWTQVTNNGTTPIRFTNSYYAVGTNSGGISYTGAVTIGDPPFNNNYSSGLRRVAVQVTWQSGGVARTQAVYTLVASNGLQNYIY